MDLGLISWQSKLPPGYGQYLALLPGVPGLEGGWDGGDDEQSAQPAHRKASEGKDMTEQRKWKRKNDGPF